MEAATPILLSLRDSVGVGLFWVGNGNSLKSYLPFPMRAATLSPHTLGKRGTAVPIGREEKVLKNPVSAAVL